MLCEKCKKNKAVTLIRQSINGVQTEIHLCENCAAQISEKFENEYGKFFSDFGFGIDSMLGSIFGQEFLPEGIISDQTERCPMCGMTLSAIRKSGNAGCGKCYETFRNQLMPFIQRIHGKTVHNGKVPSSVEGKISVKNQINELEVKLKKAIETQEFENAAQFRDEIKKLRDKIDTVEGN